MAEQNEDNRPTMSLDQFRLWKAVGALIWVDGALDPKEESWFLRCIQRFKMKPEQEQELLHIMKNGGDLQAFANEINNEHDFHQFVEFSHLLFNIDGVFSKEEQECYEALKDEYHRRFDGELANKAEEHREAAAEKEDFHIEKEREIPEHHPTLMDMATELHEKSGVFGDKRIIAIVLVVIAGAIGNHFYQAWSLDNRNLQAKGQSLRACSKLRVVEVCQKTVEERHDQCITGAKEMDDHKFNSHYITCVGLRHYQKVSMASTKPKVEKPVPRKFRSSSSNSFSR